MTPRVFGLPAGRALAALTGAGLLGTAGEAGLLHFRGAYHDPFMLPAGYDAAGRSRARWGPSPQGRKRRDRWMTRWWLRLTTLLGFAGVGFHAWGVSRNMGGWRNWRQNRAERSAAACAPQLHRPGSGRSGGTWPVGGSSGCLIASLAMTCWQAEDSVLEREDARGHGPSAGGAQRAAVLHRG